MSLEELRRDQPRLTSISSIPSAALEKIPITCGALVPPTLSDEDIRFLIPHGLLKKYLKNYPVVSQGDDGESFFLIMKGQVEVHIDNADSRTLLCRMGPGEFFGELALLMGGPRTASVTTVEDSLLVVLRKDVIFQCLSSRSTLWLALVRQLVYMVRDLTNKVSVHSLDAYARIRFYLYYLSREREGNLVIDRHWTQQHIAELSACARETVSRMLKELQKGQWIRRDKERLVILKPLPDRF